MKIAECGIRYQVDTTGKKVAAVVSINAVKAARKKRKR
jgi:hypothetical protein